MKKKKECAFGLKSIKENPIHTYCVMWLLHKLKLVKTILPSALLKDHVIQSIVFLQYFLLR